MEIEKEEKERAFIIGPIEPPLQDYNSLEFHLAEQYLNYLGYDVVNIHKLPHPKGETIDEAYVRYLYELVNSDKCFTIPGYQHSDMCRGQLVIAKEFMIPVQDLIKSNIIDGENILDTLFTIEEVRIEIDWFVKLRSANPNIKR